MSTGDVTLSVSPTTPPAAVVFNETALKARMSSLMGQYCAHIDRPKDRLILASDVQRPGIPARAFSWVAENRWPIIAGLIVTIAAATFPFIGIAIAGAAGAAVTAGLTWSVVAPLAMGGIVAGSLTTARIASQWLFARRTDSQTQQKLLTLKNLKGVTPDELWQLNRAYKEGKWAYREALAAVVNQMRVRETISAEQQDRLIQALRGCYTWSGLETTLKEMLKAVSGGANSKEVQRAADTAQVQAFSDWIEPLQALAGEEGLSWQWRTFLNDYKISFFSWLLEQRQWGDVTEEEAERLAARLDEVWMPAMAKVEEAPPGAAVPATPRVKKRLLVASCTGGGGHEIGVEVIRKALENDPNVEWEVSVARPIEEAGEIVTTVARLFGSKLTGMDLQNMAAKRDWKKLQWIITNIGPHFYKFSYGKAQRVFEERLKADRPDAVVSLIPVVANPLSRACGKWNVPYVQYPSDFMSGQYVTGTDASSPRFFHSLALPDWALVEGRGLTKGLDLRPGQLLMGGYHLKRASGEKTKEEIIEALKIPEKNAKGEDLPDTTLVVPNGKPITSIMMGSLGSTDIVEYARALLAEPSPGHVVLFCGRNDEMREMLKKEFAAHLDPSHPRSLTVLGFTKRAQDIIRISDVYLTKPGGMSVAEGWDLMSPGRFFLTKPSLKNEAGNTALTERFGFGRVVRGPEDFAAQSREALSKKITARTDRQRALLMPSWKLSTTLAHTLAAVAA